MDEHTDDCPVFVPSCKDLRRPFADFVDAKEPICLSFGVCKITPPASWFSSSATAKTQDLERKMTPSNQAFTLDSGAIGTYKAEISTGHSVTVRNFASERPDITAKLQKLRTVSDFEHQYWKSLAGGTVQYGSDIPGTLFDENVHVSDACQLKNMAAYYNVAFQATMSAFSIPEIFKLSASKSTCL